MRDALKLLNLVLFNRFLVSFLPVFLDIININKLNSSIPTHVEFTEKETRLFRGMALLNPKPV